MGNMYISAQECGREDWIWLTELLRQNRDLEVILSYGGPASKQQQPVRYQLQDMLIRLGVKANLKGYQYLVTAVNLCLEDKEEMEGITKRLYPSVARKHKAGAEQVEHAIRHAIQTAWKRGKLTEQEAIFGYHAGEAKRPTNSEFIMGLVDHIERQLT